MLVGAVGFGVGFLSARFFRCCYCWLFVGDRVGVRREEAI